MHPGLARQVPLPTPANLPHLRHTTQKALCRQRRILHPGLLSAPAGTWHTEPDPATYLISKQRVASHDAPAIGVSHTDGSMTGGGPSRPNGG